MFKRENRWFRALAWMTPFAATYLLASAISDAQQNGSGNAVAANVAVADDFPSPKSLGDVSQYGRRIQRTMRLLSESTAEKPNTVRILFYGQSITEQKWAEQVERSIRLRFPNANLVIENRALAGFSSQLLVKTAETDLYPFQPDLLVFHVYGAHDKYEDIIRRVRERTCAEILMQTDHVTKPADLDEETDPSKVPIQSGKWDAFMNHNWLPSLAAKYNAELCDQRSLWKQYLRDYNLPPKALLSDDVHLNAHGEFLMAQCVNAYLRRDPGFDAATAEETVRTLIVGKDVSWKDGRLQLDFAGNRIDVVLDKTAIARSKAGASLASVLIDGKKPSVFSELYGFTRAVTTPEGKWPVRHPVIAPISSQAPLLLEDWTMTVKAASPDKENKLYSFSLSGSKTGPDGAGRSDLEFVSKSGRVVIAPDDWNVAYAMMLSGINPPVTEFIVKWKVEPRFADELLVPEDASATAGDPGAAAAKAESVITFASGLTNGNHKLTIIANDAAAISSISAIRVYQPPFGRQP